MSQGKTNRAEVTFIIRHREIAKTSVIVWNSQNYFIKSVIPDPRNEYLTIQTEIEG